MKVDGFELKVHSVLGIVILLVVFTMAYKVGQSGALDWIPVLGKLYQ